MAPPTGVQFETTTATTAKTIAGMKSLFPYLAEPFSTSLSLTSIIFFIFTCLKSVNAPIAKTRRPLIASGM